MNAESAFAPTRRAWLALGLAAICAGLPAHADEGPVMVAGQAFARQLHLADAELQLNGTGVRGWYKAYAAGLYLRKPASDAAQVTAQPGPKRLQLRMRFDLPAGAFADAFRTGVLRNVAPEKAAPLEARIVAFETRVKALGKVHDGDVIDLDQIPGQGLLFSVNGKAQGAPIEGDDFYAALLLAFVGDKPYDTKLKAGLLGAAP